MEGKEKGSYERGGEEIGPQKGGVCHHKMRLQKHTITRFKSITHRIYIDFGVKEIMYAKHWLCSLGLLFSFSVLLSICIY